MGAHYLQDTVLDKSDTAVNKSSFCHHGAYIQSGEPHNTQVRM